MQIDVNDVTSIKEFLKTCSNQPGIYQMLSATDEVLYIGKAKNLAKRLASYFNKANQAIKVQSLVKQIDKIHTIITNSETEALILECNLIKQYKPKYNILLRDDKSYPYICFSMHKYPRIFLYRGKRPKDAICFGPFPSSYSARHTIRLLQQIFLVRVCSDKYFKNRTRPCLLYQINRCSAPCVGYAKDDDYAKNINNSKLFLEGKSKELMQIIAKQMEQASFDLQFELAAELRDRIKKLQQLAEQQYVEDPNSQRLSNKSSKKATDVITIENPAELMAAVILKFREGRLVGSNQYINKIPFRGNSGESQNEEELEELRLSIISQYYLNHADPSSMPDEIICNYELSHTSKDLVADILNNSSLKIISKPKGLRANWLDLALKNSKELLSKKENTTNLYVNKFNELTQQLSLTAIPNLIECFDVSHTFGKQTIASCVVYNQTGQDKNNYRRYNISKEIKGDDLLALKEVLHRRYKKIAEMPDNLPDLILIDGGKLQVKSAKQVLQELNLDNIALFGICKGEGRRAINDKIISGINLEEIELKHNSNALHLLQEIRNEAHRFAILGHRSKRNKEDLHSVLEDVPGIGAKRRKNLLTYLGGMQQLKAASKQQLANVPGISKAMADKIYEYLHQ